MSNVVFFPTRITPKNAPTVFGNQFGVDLEKPREPLLECLRTKYANLDYRAMFKGFGDNNTGYKRDKRVIKDDEIPVGLLSSAYIFAKDFAKDDSAAEQLADLFNLLVASNIYRVAVSELPEHLVGFIYNLIKENVNADDIHSEMSILDKYYFGGPRKTGWSTLADCERDVYAQIDVLLRTK